MNLKSIMWKYINEEHDLLQRQLASFRGAILDPAIDTIYIVAHGSSYNAGVSLAAYISRLCNADVSVNTPDNFIANLDNSRKHAGRTAVIGISQTGTSHGVIKAVEQAKEYFHIVTITNVPDSPMDRLADQTVFLNCGEEDSNAKTKGYSSTLLTLMLLAIENGCHRGVISQADKEKRVENLKREIDQIPIVTAAAYDWCEKSGFGKGMGNVYVLGSGINFGTALEGQLKLMETMCIPTMFNDILEFSHGMHRSINRDSHVILINAGSEYSRELFVRTCDYLKGKTDHCIMINVADDAVSDPGVLNVPWFRDDDSLLLTVLIIQILSVYIPELNGLDPNRDANNDYTEVAETRI